MEDASNSTIRIILVDDHMMFRKGMKLLIETEEIGQVIGEAENGQQFLDLLETLHPDVVLMDIDMPVMNGVLATEKAIEIRPGLNILGLSMFGDEKFYSKLVKAGAKGFMLKKSGIDELKKGISEVSRGECYFSSELLKNLIASLGPDPKENFGTEATPVFLKRELDIINLLAQGCSTNEIAEKVYLSPKTVDSYRSKLIAKTETKNTVDLVIYALRKKLIHL